MASELNDIKSELERMNVHLETIGNSLATIATALDRGLKDICDEIRKAR